MTDRIDDVEGPMHHALLASQRTHRRRALATLVAAALLAAPATAGAVLRTTAPHGDVNGDGFVNSVDLQCAELTFAVTAAIAQGSEAPCASDADCDAASYCRSSFSEVTYCLPRCLGVEVALGEAQSSPCDDPQADTADCLGTTPRANADLDCDGALTNTDFDFIVALITEQVGGEGTPDHDADGKLNFCDDDSEQDGHPDHEDCQVLDEAPDLTVCGPQAPTAPAIAVTPEAPTADDDITATITAPSTDPDGDRVAYLYTWRKGGAAATGLDRLSPVLPASRTLDDEVWVLEVRATDGAHTSEPATLEINIGNGAPVITSIVVTPQTPSRLDTLTCDVDVSDPDQDPLTLTYSWTVNDATVDGADSHELSASGLLVGDSVRCSVSADDGVTRPRAATADPVLIGNLPPTVGDVAVSPTAFDRGGTPTCTAAVDDPESAQLTVTVSWLVDEAVVDDTGALDAPWANAAAHLVRGAAISCHVHALDDAGDSAEGTASAVVVDNAVPTLATITTSPVATAAQTDDIDCQQDWGAGGVFTDADGDAPWVTVTWLHKPAGAATFVEVESHEVGHPVDGRAGGPDPADAFRLNAAEIPAGANDQIACRIDVSDRWATSCAPDCPAGAVDGTASRQTAPAVTIGNAQPIIASVGLSPTDPTRNDTLSCSQQSSDPDDDPVTVTYAWTVNGEPLAGATDPTLSAASLTPGDVVRCVVTADDGISTPAEATSEAATVRNLDPTVADVALAPGSFDRTGQPTCSATIADADDTDPSVTVEWLVDGAVADDTGALDTAWANAGAHLVRGASIACRVTASDAHGGAAAATSGAIVVDNASPRLAPTGGAEALSLSPSAEVEQDGTVDCTQDWSADGIYSDADGDTPWVTITWLHKASGAADFTEFASYEIGHPTDGGGADEIASSVVLDVATIPAGAGDEVACRVDVSDRWASLCEPSCPAGAADGTATATTAAVRVLNASPVIESVAVSPTDPTRNDSVTCSATTSDADGDDVAVTYAWTVNGVAVDGATSASLSASAYVPGDQITCTVTADDGTSTPAEATADPAAVVQNADPVVADVALSPASFDRTAQPTCSATVSDSDDASPTVVVEWLVDGAVVDDAGALDTAWANADAHLARNGSITCRVTATDPYGGSGQGSSAAVVVDNASPTLAPTGGAATLLLDPADAVAQDGTLDCTQDWSEGGVFADADGDDPWVTVVWLHKASGATEFTEFASYEVGHPVDGGGADDPATSWSLSVDSIPAGAEDEIACRVDVSDRWATLCDPDCPAGATDGTATATTAAVTVDNASPVIASVAVTPSDPLRTQTLTCEHSVSDPDGDEFTITYAWLVNDAVVDGATAATFSAAALQPDDTVRCRVTADDSLAAAAEATSDPVTVQNASPTIADLTITPSPFHVAQQPICNATIDDAEDASPTVTVHWLKGGVLLDAQGALGAPWTKANTVERLDIVSCQVTVTDADGAQTTATSAGVVVDNAPPTMTPPSGQTAFATNPRASARRNEDIDCNQAWLNEAIYSDPDDDPAYVTITWLYKASGATEFTAVETLEIGDPILGRAGGPDPADAFVINPTEVSAGPGDEFKCRLLVSDNWANNCPANLCPDGAVSGEVTVETSPAVTIENNAPTLQSVQVAPTSPRVGDTIACATTGANDVDGDDITIAYEFFVNDNSVQGPGPDDDINTGFAKGDSVRCEATPSDAHDQGATTTSVAVTVVNTPPAAVTPTVLPTAPNRNEELVCNFTAPTSPDVDGDTITTIVVWLKEVDGALTESGHTGTPLAASATSACERWACRVDASDSEEVTAATSATVEIIGDTAATFNGSTSVVSVGSSAFEGELARVAGLSIEMWFRRTASSSVRTLFNKPNGDAASYPDADELRLEILASGEVAATFRPYDRDDPTYANAAVTVQGSTVTSANTWHHVLFVADAAAATASLYLDGALEATATATPPDDPTGDVYTFGVTGATVGRRCVGTCAGGLGDRAFGGDIDELHFSAAAATPATVPFTPADEATATDDTLFLFGFNEAAQDVSPDLAVDRGGPARHGTPTGLTWSGSDRKGGCTTEPTFAPVPAQLVTTPASAAAYPGVSFTCAADVVEVSVDPEGEAVTDQIRWALDGVVDATYDGQGTLDSADVADCVDVRCDLVTTDASSTSATRSRAWLGRSATTAGVSVPPHSGVTSFGSQSDHLAALGPLIEAPEQTGWTVSMWARFAATPSKDTAITIGDQPGGSPANLDSYIDIDFQRRTSAQPVEGLSYSHDCGIHITAFTWFSGEYIQTADHFAVIKTELGVLGLADPCGSASWYHVAIQRLDDTFTVLAAELTSGATAPAALSVIGTFTDSDANDTALMLASMSSPTIALTRFGSVVHLDDLHILSGQRYATAGGDVPLIAEAATSATRLLWSMEPITGLPGFLEDLGPWALPASVTDGGTAPAGLGDSCP